MHFDKPKLPEVGSNQIWSTIKLSWLLTRNNNECEILYKYLFNKQQYYV